MEPLGSLRWYHVNGNFWNYLNRMKYKYMQINILYFINKIHSTTWKLVGVWNFFFDVTTGWIKYSLRRKKRGLFIVTFFTKEISKFKKASTYILPVSLNSSIILKTFNLNLTLLRRHSVDKWLINISTAKKIIFTFAIC